MFNVLVKTLNILKSLECFFTLHMCTQALECFDPFIDVEIHPWNKYLSALYPYLWIITGGLTTSTPIQVPVHQLCIFYTYVHKAQLNVCTCGHRDLGNQRHLKECLRKPWRSVYTCRNACEPMPDPWTSGYGCMCVGALGEFGNRLYQGGIQTFQAYVLYIITGCDGSLLSMSWAPEHMSAWVSPSRFRFLLW